jgi:hypothetical protein
MKRKIRINNRASAFTKIKAALLFTTITTAAFAVLFNLDHISEAQRGFTDHPSASFGLTPGQAARLSVVNPDARRGKTVEVQFVDEAGNVLKTTRATIEPKQTFGMLLPYGEIGRAEARVQVRATVRLRGPASNRLLGGVEVYDEATGKTSFGLLLPASDFDPQSEPPSP